jgi:hypothetical protein
MSAVTISEGLIGVVRMEKGEMSLPLREMKMG